MMLFQYKIFLKKEWKLLKRQPKLIIISLLTSLVPLLQLVAHNPMLSLEFYVPYYLVFVSIISSEFTNTLINTEFDYQTYELLKVSAISKPIIVLGKITLPVFISLTTLIVGLALNSQLQQFTTIKIAVQFFSIDYLFYSVLTILFSHLFVLYAAIRGETKKAKERFTLTAGITFVISFIIYSLYFFGLTILAYAILVTLIIVTYMAILKMYQDVPQATLTSARKSIQNINHLFEIQANVLTDSYFNLKYLSLVLGIAVLIRLFFALTLEPLVVQFIVIFISSSLFTKLSFEGVIRSKKSRIYPLLKLSNLTTNQMILYHLIRPLIIQLVLNVSLCLVFGYANTVRLTLISLVMALIILLGSFLVKAIQFKAYFQIFSAITSMGVATLCLVSPLPELSMVLVSILVYGLIYFVYHKYFEQYFN